MVNSTPRPFYPRGRDTVPVPVVLEAEWAPWPFGTSAENLAPPRFDPRAVYPVASRSNDTQQHVRRPTRFVSEETIVSVYGSGCHVALLPCCLVCYNTLWISKHTSSVTCSAPCIVIYYQIKRTKCTCLLYYFISRT